MKILNKKLLQQFIKLAGEHLKGEWVLLGGTLLPLLGVEYRVTVDIDLVPLEKHNNSQILKLMSIAETLDLPIESINQAASFFLMKQKSFKEHLTLLYQGRSATIYRPDLFLFLMLKIGRLTQTDLSDCLEMIKKEKNISTKENLSKMKKQIHAEMKNDLTEKKIQRLNQILQALE